MSVSPAKNPQYAFKRDCGTDVDPKEAVDDGIAPGKSAPFDDGATIAAAALPAAV
jgi:hypothetical protein